MTLLLLLLAFVTVGSGYFSSEKRISHVPMSVTPRGATENCPLLRAEPNTDTRMQETGPCDRPPMEIPCHITWLMMLHVSRDNAMEPTHTRKVRRIWKLCKNSRNVNKTLVAALNVDALSGRSFELAETLERGKIDLCVVQETRTQDTSTINVHEPVTLTISPKIWNLLETKAALITNTVKSIQFPEKDEKVSKLLKYKVWDGHFEQFAVPKSGVTFEDMNNGVHLRMKNVQFRGSIQARLYIGGKLGHIRVSGGIKVSSSNAELDIVLAWNDFTFTPTVAMNSNLRIDFEHHLRRFNAIRSHVQKLATKAVNKKVPEKLVEVIQKELNPRLQKLKQKLVAKGITQYDIEWTVQNQNLRSMTDVDVTCVEPVAKCEGLSCSYCTDVDVNPAKSGGGGDVFHNCIPGF
ncbi:unnamed protein product [Heligmosomoides polygyrus]|uniref:Endo/exonuclease/phosphatase domain-containing protein n=1 Tax=Heligmosomoides polygyrus TaxID=6339 RepID=A0A183FRT2_HELPZ|nr:unnamed protein product [Heligmosomoides polygyrus]